MNVCVLDTRFTRIYKEKLVDGLLSIFSLDLLKYFFSLDLEVMGY